ncbi:MAG: Asp-tRNA(Asn)/Glu-tRNA(Gln) amidotransferase subunit GatC [Minisyncoccota bacterium]
MIEKKDIEKLALLARIEVSEEEKEALAKSIESILGYVGQVTSVSEKAGTTTPVLVNVMRDDEVLNTPGEFTEALLSNAPHRDGNYLEVKKILG